MSGQVTVRRPWTGWPRRCPPVPRCSPRWSGRPCRQSWSGRPWRQPWSERRCWLPGSVRCSRTRRSSPTASWSPTGLPTAWWSPTGLPTAWSNPSGSVTATCCPTEWARGSASWSASASWWAWAWASASAWAWGSAVATGSAWSSVAARAHHPGRGVEPGPPDRGDLHHVTGGRCVDHLAAADVHPHVVDAAPTAARGEEEQVTGEKGGAGHGPRAGRAVLVPGNPGQLAVTRRPVRRPHQARAVERVRPFGSPDVRVTELLAGVRDGGLSRGVGGQPPADWST